MLRQLMAGQGHRPADPSTPELKSHSSIAPTSRVPMLVVSKSGLDKSTTSSPLAERAASLVRPMLRANDLLRVVS